VTLGPADPPSEAGCLDPNEWAAVYETARPNGHQLVFRAGAEIGRRACLAVASPGERWLDVGCGTGHLVAALAAAGLRVTGVDSDSRMIAAAEARFPELSFDTADASSLPFADGSVDGVVATSVLGCLDDPAGFVAEAARVVRPEGKVVLTFTNRSSPLHAIGNCLALLERRRSPTYAAARLFSTAEAIELLRQAGFAVERLRYYNCFLGTARGSFPPPRFVSALEPLVNVHPLVGSLLGRNLLTIASKRQGPSAAGSVTGAWHANRSQT
jgi:ubiquinone/menaquinone biosynthesis C-methylase UbiE